jgi:hypothetical protein
MASSNVLAALRAVGVAPVPICAARMGITAKIRYPHMPLSVP